MLSSALLIILGVGAGGYFLYKKKPHKPHKPKRKAPSGVTNVRLEIYNA